MTRRHAPIERGDDVHPSFWFCAGALLTAKVLGAPLDGAAAVAVATIVFLGGGMPHGAYDIALLTRTVRLGRRAIVLAATAYVAVAIAMTALWMTAPSTALVVFLGIAAIHFGADWTMLRESLLKVAAGAAILAAPAIAHRTEVARIFSAMSDPVSGRLIAHVLVAAAPLSLLVTAVGVSIAWLEGARAWAVAMTLSFALLLVLPPVAGFALFFVFLHSPRHLAVTRATLRDVSPARWIVTGGAMSLAALAGWLALTGLLPALVASDRTAQAFQLLAAVAVPHLLLSIAIERVCAADERERSLSPSFQALLR